MSGLQRLTPIDLTRPNLSNVPIQLSCVPGEGDGRSDTRQLCERLSALLTNQGAIIIDDLQEDERIELKYFLRLTSSLGTSVNYLFLGVSGHISSPPGNLIYSQEEATILMVV